ncbi:beta-mannosidase [Tenuifilum sp.]|uniref:beta-mannosidase n=2 Tax=Tenuifilum sp. TaxID=2760880 RepID=UPI002CC6C19B|nr:glycoside hydrolase family 2 protein [Tenuifilum sp.]HON71329.1 glycoside hydrolase family 2 protein [Tenuifilum sp.]HPP90496.1 glycoside hydrolase family 2 protein [Tenuifilum sp.]
MKKAISVLVLWVMAFAALSQQEFPLNGQWQFRRANSSDGWLPATVPGAVHTHLHSNGMIGNPYLGCNNMHLAWIDSADWEYRKVFALPKTFSSIRDVELVFEGLDTYADVYLNGVKVLTADNMFRRWVVPCSKFLRKGKNELRVVFRSAVRMVDSIAGRGSYRLPGGEWAYVRKAAYHFGWDWGPRFVTCGIWKPVYLRITPKVRVSNLSISTISVSNQKALMAIDFDIDGDTKAQLRLTVTDVYTDKIYLDTAMRLKRHEVGARFYIDNPKLWWPNGMGEQHLNRFRVQFFEDRKLVYDKVHDVGIRTVRLISEPDSSGQSFYFLVNGLPMFAKGANLIPPDFFVHSIADSAWVQQVDFAAQSNFNMLRVWGGGVYAPDAFMEECTRKGILVWHDFMFACSMYPYSSAFLTNVKEEAVEQVKRLRKHTSLALWCGNNEVDEGWHNWGWQKQLSDYTGAADSVWNGYVQLFLHLLPEVVMRYDSTRSYWPSSPMFGWGRAESTTHGDSHYWGVWWGREPFERYAQRIPRFMSEYGFQGAPSEETLRMFNDRNNLPDSAQMLCHQKHPVGYQTINEYMEREGLKPNDLLEWIDYSQLVQAQGYAHAIEAHRLASPYCMGTLYWQLNDCWPVVSWSGIDYAERWKRVQYYVQNLYKPVIAGAHLEDTLVVVKAVSDSIKPIQASISAKVFDINGNELNQFNRNLTLQPNVAVEVGRIPFANELVVRNDIYLKLTVSIDNETRFESVYYFTRSPHKDILGMGMVQRIREIKR